MLGLGSVALALSGCGDSAHVGAPFVKSDSLEAGGLPVLGSAPTGLTLRFIEQGRFGIGIVLRNGSARRVTVVDVHTPEPAGGLVSQIGTRLVPWNPKPCRGRLGCPLITFLRSSFGAVRPAALVVAPGKGIGIQLNYRLASCSAVPFASPSAAQSLEVDYRLGSGSLRAETLPLGSARLRLRMPTPSDCLRRPHSQIALDAPFATSSAWTIPGSNTVTCTRTSAGTLHCTGSDTCTRTRGGGLIFRSGLYQSPGKPAVRVAIRLPRLARKGLYRTQSRPAAALGPADVRVIAGVGIHGWTTYCAGASAVTVTRATGTTLGGRFHATLIGPRKVSFRAYGTWRCATSMSR